MNNYFRVKKRDLITQFCRNSNGGLDKPVLSSGMDDKKMGCNY